MYKLTMQLQRKDLNDCYLTSNSILIFDRYPRTLLAQDPKLDTVSPDLLDVVFFRV